MGWRNRAGSIRTQTLSRLQPSKSKEEAGDRRSRLLQTAIGGALFPCFPVWHPCFPSHVVCIYFFFHVETLLSKSSAGMSGAAMQPLLTRCSHLQLSSFWQSGKSWGDSRGTGRFVFLLHAETLCISRWRCQGRGSKRKSWKKDTS